jgi:GalNAc-alpha-(1->4)-GalNAc-alpha-(1->3)-diNAcBac-PP-undecaprenol alpha-1,4-N-acetyl-D-galactosaminyltransferase
MKIIFLISSLTTGGAERVATILCNAWSSREDTVTLISTYLGGMQSHCGACDYDISERVETIFLAKIIGAEKRGLLSYLRKIVALRQLVKARRPDVIISFLPNVNVAAILSTSFMRVPLIICERSDPLSRPCRNLLEIMCRLTYRFADVLTVQTESVARKVAKVYPKLLKISVVPNPLSTNTPPPFNVEKGQRKVLLSIGRLSSEKRIENIIESFSVVALGFEEWDLHIYGDGHVKPALVSLIEELGLASRIYLHGGTTKPLHVMANADAFIMASLYEGFPNALLEAMSVGLPCIVTDCPSGPKEITRNGKDGILVPLHNRIAMVSALERLMGNAALRDELGRQARESVWQRFNLGSVLSCWDEIFENVGVTNFKGRPHAADLPKECLPSYENGIVLNNVSDESRIN